MVTCGLCSWTRKLPLAVKTGALEVVLSTYSALEMVQTNLTMAQLYKLFKYLEERQIHNSV